MIGCMPRSSSSTSLPVEMWPVFVLVLRRRLSISRCSSPNSTSLSFWVELMLNSWPDVAVDLGLEAADPALQLLAELGQVRQVDRDADALHVRQHRHQRHLDVAEQRGLARLVQLALRAWA